MSHKKAKIVERMKPSDGQSTTLFNYKRADMSHVNHEKGCANLGQVT